MSYLKGSYGFLSGFYHWMASDPNLVQVIDFVNIWGMILLGAGLFLGLLTRISAVSGIILLTLYYFAYPPFGNFFWRQVYENLQQDAKMFYVAMFDEVDEGTAIFKVHPDPPVGNSLF